MKKKELLNEIMGVPRALDTWVEYFNLILAGMAKSISQSDEMEEADVEYRNPNNPDEIIEGVAYRGSKTMDGKTVMNWIEKIGGYSDLRGLLKDPKFREFPLYNPTLNITVTFVPNELYDAEVKNDPSSSTSASYGWSPNTIKISKLGGDNLVFVGQQFKFNVMVPVSWIESFDINQFRKMIKPVIGHELTHAYETYKRFSSTGDPMFGREGFLNTATKLTKDFKYPQWNYFLDLIYLSLSFEINARIVQLYNQMMEAGVKDQKQFMDILYKSSVWDEVKKLESFNAEEFIQSFKKVDLDFFEMLQDMETQMVKAKHGQVPIKNIRNNTEAMKHLSDVWDKTLQKLNVDITNHFSHLYKGKLMDKVPQSAKETPMRFFKFFEKRFHNKADKFKRKLFRLSSLVLNGEQEKIDEGLGNTLATAILGATLAFGGMGKAEAQTSQNKEKIEYSQEKSNEDEGQREIRRMIKSMGPDESVGYSLSQDKGFGEEKAMTHARESYIKKHNLGDDVKLKVDLKEKKTVKLEDGRYLTIVKIKINK